MIQILFLASGSPSLNDRGYEIYIRHLESIPPSQLPDLSLRINRQYPSAPARMILLSPRLPRKQYITILLAHINLYHLRALLLCCGTLLRFPRSAINRYILHQMQTRNRNTFQPHIWAPRCLRAAKTIELITATQLHARPHILCWVRIRPAANTITLCVLREHLW